MNQSTEDKGLTKMMERATTLDEVLKMLEDRGFVGLSIWGPKGDQRHFGLGPTQRGKLLEFLKSG